jgi:hypothetical protein
MICETDTIQFYPKIWTLQEGQEVSKPGCISFNDVGINITWPPGDIFSLLLGEQIKVNILKSLTYISIDIKRYWSEADLPKAKWKDCNS